MRISFKRKENKNNNFIQQFFTSKSRIPPLSRVPLHVNNACAWCCWHRTGMLTSCLIYVHRKACAFIVVPSIVAEYMIWRRRNAEFVFFEHKKYFRSFIKLRLNHWCHMDYFNSIAVHAGTDFIQNLLICVPIVNGFGTTWGLSN